MSNTAPSTTNYTLGKGMLYLARYSEDAAVTEADFKAMGNCPTLTVAVNQEKLEHYSSMGGVNKKDAETTTTLGYTLSPTTDEITNDNLAIFFQGQMLPNGKIKGLADTNQEFALRFVTDNPMGPNRVWDFHRVKLAGNGDAALIGSEWMQLGLTGEGLADDKWHADSTFFDITPAADPKPISPWAAGASYAAGDFVTNTTSTYVCNTAHVADATFEASNWSVIDPWQATAPVLANDYVLQESKVYQAPVAFTTKATFADDDGYWILVAA